MHVHVCMYVDIYAQIHTVFLCLAGVYVSVRANSLVYCIKVLYTLKAGCMPCHNRISPWKKKKTSSVYACVYMCIHVNKNVFCHLDIANMDARKDDYWSKLQDKKKQAW